MALTAADWAALADHCRALPGTTEDRKWDDHPVFSVGGKMYAILSSEPSTADRVSLAAELDRFVELTDIPGVIPAPYLARHHWVSVLADTVLGRDALLGLADAAHARVLAKLPARRRQAILGGA